MSLIHPRKQASRRQFYPHTVTISKGAGRTTPGTDQSGFMPIALPGLVDLPCAFSEGKGALPATWQTQTPAGDTVLLSGYFPQIKAKLQARITVAGIERTFIVNDAIADDLATQTMLTLSPI